MTPPDSDARDSKALRRALSDPSTSDQLGALKRKLDDSDAREVLCTGQRAEVSIAMHRQRLRVMFEENEARPLPDTALRSVLLDADRFADEYAAAPRLVGIESDLAQRILAALEEHLLFLDSEGYSPELGASDAALVTELRAVIGK